MQEKAVEHKMKKVYEGNLVEIYEVFPNIYFRKANLPVRDQCNGAYFTGALGVGAVDAPPGGIEMIDEAQKLFQKPLKWLFLTHGHGDHIDGLDDFLDLDITVFCHRRLLEELEQKIEGRKATFVGVEGRMKIRISGIEIELFTLPDITHSKWDMYIRHPETGVLCTGDAVVEYQTAFYHGTDLDTWISSLKKLAAEDGRYIFAGHAEVPYEYRYMDSFVEHLETVRRAATDCFSRYNYGERKSDRERFEDASSKDIFAFVETYFSERGEDAEKISKYAGNEAKRQVRMAMYPMIRKVLV